MSRLCEEFKLVPIFNSADINAGADSDSICVKNYRHVTLLCMFGPSLAGAAGAILTLYEGATDAAKTAALTFSYRYGGAATGTASSDVLSTETTSAALTCTSATFLSRLLVIEVDMDTMTDGYDWLTLQVGAEADAGQLTVVAVMYPKYGEASLHTALS